MRRSSSRRGVGFVLCASDAQPHAAGQLSQLRETRNLEPVRPQGPIRPEQGIMRGLCGTHKEPPSLASPLYTQHPHGLAYGPARNSKLALRAFCPSQAGLPEDGVRGVAYRLLGIARRGRADRRSLCCTRDRTACFRSAQASLPQDGERVGSGGLRCGGPRSRSARGSSATRTQLARESSEKPETGQGGDLPPRGVAALEVDGRLAESLHWPTFQENSLSPPPPVSSKNSEAARKVTMSNHKSAATVGTSLPDSDIQRLVRLDGLAVRRRRHDHGWSPRDLLVAIEEACFNATGLRRTLTPNLIQSIEEREERIPYDELLLLADGLACDPSDLIAEGEMSNSRAGRNFH